MKNIKLQYYLRGLGVGILVTAVLMGTVQSGPAKELTDAEIKKRAMELGMVDENSLVLSDLQGDQFVKVDSVDAIPEKETSQAENIEQTEPLEEEEITPTETETIVPGATESDERITEEIATEETLAEETVSEEVTTEESLVHESESQEESEEDDSQEAVSQPRVMGALHEDGSTVTITIHSGANSYSVSKVLADTGLVSSAKAYDDFLCDGGYSKKIHTGNYVIAIGTSEEEIAKIITGNR